MATINDKKTIDAIIAGNGYFEDDTRVYMIVEYVNAWGGIAYGVTWFSDLDKGKYLNATEYINNPKVIWKAN